MAGVLWKAVGIGSGVASRKAATSLWKVAVGSEPPAAPEDPGVSWREALAWAVVSGALAGAGRLVVTRGIAEYWQKSTGAPPAAARDDRS